MVCLLQEVDIGNLLTLTSERLPVLDLIQPLFYTEQNAMYIRPGIGPNMAGFIMAFSPTVSDQAVPWYKQRITDVIVACALR